MLGLLLKLLGGPLGGAIASGAAALLILTGVTAAVQSLRLNHTKHDLVEARAAQKDPATGKPWKLEAETAAANYATCQKNEATLSDGLNAQNLALERLAAAGDLRERQVAQALQAAQKAATAAQSNADRILKLQPAGADECQKLLSVDAAVLGAHR